MVDLRRESAKFELWSQRITGQMSRMASKRREWTNYRRIMTGEKLLLPEKLGSHPEMKYTTNHFFAYMRLILPTIYFRNPDSRVDPCRGVPQVFAMLWEALLDHQLEECHYQRQARACVVDALRCGHGVLKHGFVSNTVDGSKNVETAILDDFVNNVNQTFEDMGSEEEHLRSTMKPKSDPDKYRVAGELEPADFVQQDLPYAFRVDPCFWFIDPGAHNIEDASWVGHAVLKHMSGVRKGSRYSSSVARSIKTGRRLDTSVDPFSMGTDDLTTDNPDDEDYVFIFEIWDKDTDKVYIMDEYNTKSQDRKSFLAIDPWPYTKLRGFPFNMLVFNEDPDDPRGISDMQQWHSPAAMDNFMSSLLLSHARRYAASKTLMIEHSMDVEEQGKFSDPTMGGIVKVKDPQGGMTSPASLVVPHAYPPLPQEVYSLREISRDGMDMVTAVTDQRKGLYSKTGKSATQANFEEVQQGMRDSDRFAIVAEFVQRSLRTFEGFDREFMRPEYIEHLHSFPEIMLWFVAFPQIMEAGINIRVTAGTSAYVPEQERLQKLQALFEMIGPLVDPVTGFPVMNTVEWARRVLGEMNIPDYDGLLLAPEQALQLAQARVSAAMSGGLPQGGPSQSPLHEQGATAPAGHQTQAGDTRPELQGQGMAPQESLPGYGMGGPI